MSGLAINGNVVHGFAVGGQAFLPVTTNKDGSLNVNGKKYEESGKYYYKESIDAGSDGYITYDHSKINPNGVFLFDDTYSYTHRFFVDNTVLLDDNTSQYYLSGDAVLMITANGDNSRSMTLRLDSSDYDVTSITIY